jgi:lysophospholipase L1-like esterase
MNNKNVLLFLLLLVSGCSTRETVMRSSPRILLFGDSITEQGVKPNGYVTILRDTLNTTLGQKIEVIGAGISGNKVSDLQRRLKSDVLEKNPSIVVIYIGINDVWHFEFVSRGLTGTPKPEFEKGLKEIIAQIQSAGAMVILCTPSVIGEKNDGTNKYDAMLDEYSAISRSVAAQSSIPLCDLRSAFVDYLKKNNPSNAEKNVLTTDGVHLNDAGNTFVAGQILSVLDGLGLFFPQK